MNYLGHISIIPFDLGTKGKRNISDFYGKSSNHGDPKRCYYLKDIEDDIDDETALTTRDYYLMNADNIMDEIELTISDFDDLINADNIMDEMDDDIALIIRGFDYL